ncbi:MAG: hypothetical protein IT518_20615 [Burkholderiales bacterium]|nr:hypothetical protein [Burkholderiales bacterium]
MEGRCGWPEGYLDGAAPPARPAAAPELSPLESRLLAAFGDLIAKQQEKVLAEVEEQAEENRGVAAAMARKAGRPPKESREILPPVPTAAAPRASKKARPA